MQSDATQLKVLRKLTLIGHGAQGLCLKMGYVPFSSHQKSKKEVLGKLSLWENYEAILLKVISSHKKRKKKSDREKPKSGQLLVAPLRN